MPYRDPRVEPKPGDVWEKEELLPTGIVKVGVRKVQEVRGENVVYNYQRFLSGVLMNGRRESATLPAFTRWSRTARLVRTADEASDAR